MSAQFSNQVPLVTLVVFGVQNNGVKSTWSRHQTSFGA